MSAYQVNKRHAFLQRLIFVKKEEVTSYENMNTCVTTVTACVLVFSLLEVISYYLSKKLVLFYSFIRGSKYSVMELFLLRRRPRRKKKALEVIRMSS